MQWGILCFFDSLGNAFAVFEYSLKESFKLFTWTTPLYVDVWPKVIYPAQNITFSASLCMTLAIAVER